MIKCPFCGTKNVDILQEQTAWMVYSQDEIGIQDTPCFIPPQTSSLWGYCIKCDENWLVASTLPPFIAQQEEMAHA